MNAQKISCLHVSTSSREYETLDTAYPQTALLSSLKTQIGLLLFCLQTPLNRTDKQNYWQLFENVLRYYIDLKILQNVSGEGFNGAESTKHSRSIAG